ncbi:hypothetical protein [Actinosynnema sp.]|uniref:hypothetical protein n=1 Tax=Actinosynnema sp. TaxID=1872144 RepID=UPI003F87EF1D
MWARADRASRMVAELSADPDFRRARVVRGPLLTPDTGGTGKVRLRGWPPDGRVWRNTTTPARAEVASTLDGCRGRFARTVLDPEVRRVHRLGALVRAVGRPRGRQQPVPRRDPGLLSTRVTVASWQTASRWFVSGIDPVSDIAPPRTQPRGNAWQQLSSRFL